jgi:solute carrier family 25 (mitochondrial phosphate transporter), member 23/24/25/41
MIGAFKKVIGKEGFLAFWKGNGTSVVHRFPYSAMNFAMFEYTKRFFITMLGENDGDVAYHQMGLIRFISGAVAGATATATCYPLDLVRTRLTTQVANTRQNYNGILHALYRIAKDEGFFGL